MVVFVTCILSDKLKQLETIVEFNSLFQRLVQNDLLKERNVYQLKCITKITFLRILRFITL